MRAAMRPVTGQPESSADAAYRQCVATAGADAELAKVIEWLRGDEGLAWSQDQGIHGGALLDIADALQNRLHWNQPIKKTPRA